MGVLRLVPARKICHFRSGLHSGLFTRDEARRLVANIAQGGDFGVQESIDLTGIRFGVHTTLGYSENSSDTGGILSVKEGTHVAKIALLGNYMAASFVTAADGHGGTLIMEGSQTANQLVPLTTPHTG